MGSWMQGCKRFLLSDSVRLSDCVKSRDNNLNLLRIVAALAVLVGHSFALLAQPEPWGARWGMTPGSVAVDLFFVASGLLVCGSLVSKQSLLDYFCARVLRIFPALLVMLLLTVLVLGPYFTELPLAMYLMSAETLLYLKKCATLITGVAFTLPGVFAHNPYPYAVNGSLWTMPLEIKMYLLLMIFWAITGLFRQRRMQVFHYLLPGLALVALAIVLERHFLYAEIRHFERLFLMFFSGAAMYMLREKILLIPRLLYVLLPVTIASVLINRELFFFLYTLSFAYLVLCLAYLPSGWIRQYNKLGDYSYGVYIYAFPVQQSIAALFPHISVAMMIASSMAITLVLAVLSWHGVEKPALERKEKVLVFLNAVFRRRHNVEKAGAEKLH